MLVEKDGKEPKERLGKASNSGANLVSSKGERTENRVDES